MASRWPIGVAERFAVYAPEALTEVRNHPNFRDACEAAAADALKRRDSYTLDEVWLTKDIGRASMLVTAPILDAVQIEGVSVRGLAKAVSTNGQCSRGRVISFVERAIRAGWIDLPAGAGVWTKRRLTLNPPLLGFLRREIAGVFQSASLIAPEIARAMERLQEPAAVRLCLLEIGATMLSHPEFGRPETGRLHPFLANESGMMVLQSWLIDQPRERARLVEVASVSRRALSRRFSISRAHINELIAQAQAAGLLRLTSANSVAFDPLLSDELETYYALLFQGSRRSARTILEAGV